MAKVEFKIGTTPNPNSIRIGLSDSVFPKPESFNSAEQAEVHGLRGYDGARHLPSMEFCFDGRGSRQFPDVLVGVGGDRQVEGQVVYASHLVHILSRVFSLLG